MKPVSICCEQKHIIPSNEYVSSYPLHAIHRHPPSPPAENSGDFPVVVNTSESLLLISSNMKLMCESCCRECRRRHSQGYPQSLLFSSISSVGQTFTQGIALMLRNKRKPTELLWARKSAIWHRKIKDVVWWCCILRKWGGACDLVQAANSSCSALMWHASISTTLSNTHHPNLLASLSCKDFPSFPLLVNASAALHQFRQLLIQPLHQPTIHLHTRRGG